MIKQKLKICQNCLQQAKIFSKNCCLRCWQILYQKPIPKQSDKEKERLKEYYVERERLLKEFPICQCCNILPSEEIHHKISRQFGIMDHLVPICRTCHTKIHNEPEWAMENGWLISKFKK